MRLLEHAIVVTPQCRKPLFLAYRQAYPEDDITLLTVEELENLFLYHYDDRAIRYLIERGKGYKEAKDILKAIAYIKLGKHYQKPRLIELQKLAAELVELEYLYKDEYAKRMFLGKNIVLDGYQMGKRISYALDDVPNICMNWLPQKAIEKKYPRIAEFSNIYGELHYICNLIADDIAHGTKPEDILISGYNEEYRLPLSLMSEAYGFTVALPSSSTIYETKLGKTFLGLVNAEDQLNEERLTNCLNSLSDAFGEDPGFSFIVKTAFGLFCNGISKGRQMKVYVEALKERRTPSPAYDHTVGLLNEDFVIEGKHIYRIDFNLNNAPHIENDNDFLFDEEKKELGMPTSLDKNKEAKANLLALLSSPNMVSVSYHARHLNNQKNPSSLMAASPETLSETSPMLVLSKPTLDYEYSEAFARIWGASLLDEYEQFGVLAPELNALKDKLGVGQNLYSNEYVHFKDAENPSGRLSLSASSLDTFYHCPFHYYCNYLLGINDSETGFSVSVGTIFHDVLEHYYDADFDLPSAYETAIKDEEGKRGEPFTVREHVLLGNLFDYLKRDIDFLARHDELMHSPENPIKSPVEYLREFSKTIPLGGNLYLTGKADKIILTENTKAKYATFVDYKTYAKRFQKKHVPYGFSLQLPLYAYLAKNLTEFSEYQTLGLFIAPILPSALYGQDGKSLADIRKATLKLEGVFLDDQEGLATLDYGWMKSEIIASCNYGKSGFGKTNSHVIGQVELDDIIKETEQKILEAGQRIRAGDFKIEASYIKGEDSPCEYCPFRDVCYRTVHQLNIIRLNAEEGGEENG